MQTESNSSLPEVGSRIEDAKLLDSTGLQRTLSEIAGGRTLVVIFYRGAW